jgi:hypothetical protein
VVVNIQRSSTLAVYSAESNRRQRERERERESEREKPVMYSAHQSWPQVDMPRQI